MGSQRFQMNRAIFLIVVVACFFAKNLLADTNISYSVSVGSPVPEGNPAGIVSSANVSGLAGNVLNVQVSLNITGGFNGDLYAYLAGPGGGFAVLLNRVGITSGNPFGYADSGFNITLGDGYSNIHNYQNADYTITGGQLVGNYAPDGRNINPQSTGSVFDLASTASSLNVFNASNPNGTWTLFVADLASGGGSPQLVSWGLTIAIPEPQSWAIILTGGGLLLAMRQRRS